MQEFSSLTQIKTAINNIVALNRPYYDVGLSGGEPTIHPHMFDIIALLRDALGKRLNSVVITTNGSRNALLYEKLVDISKYLHLRMMISIHTDHVDMNHILDLIERLSGNALVQFALMFNPDKREMVHEIFDTLLEYRKQFPFIMTVTMLRDGDRVDPRYTQEDFNWQKKTAAQFQDVVRSVKDKIILPKGAPRRMKVFHDVEDEGTRKIIEAKNRTLNFKNGLLQFGGMYCVSYATCLQIESSGLCRGIICTADRPLGNIYKEDIFKNFRDNLIHSVKCPMHTCGCVSNDRVPKFASEEEAKNFVRVMNDKQQTLFDEYLNATNK